MFRPDVDRPLPLPASALETLQQARAAKERAIRQQSLLRRKTFAFFDTMRDLFKKMVHILSAKEPHLDLNIQLQSHPNEPTAFSLVHPFVTVWLEIKQPGLIYISFGIPEPQNHTMYNWILRGLPQDNEVHWYFYNMRDQVGPDFKIEDCHPVIRFVLHEWLIEYQDYLDGRGGELDWRLLKHKDWRLLESQSKKGTV